MKRQKVEKLSERPDTGLSDVDWGLFIIGDKINQMPVCNLFN
jgi:hypothetical protein